MTYHARDIASFDYSRRRIARPARARAVSLRESRISHECHRLCVPGVANIFHARDKYNAGLITVLQEQKRKRGRIVFAKSRVYSASSYF